MNEQQNPDGTWSEAEPIKASWKLKRFKGFLVVYKRTGYVPFAVQFDTYEDALNALEEITRDKLNYDSRVIVCILNHKLEVVYKKEAGIDAD